MAWRVSGSESGTRPAARASAVRSRVKLDRVEASSLSCARACGVQFRSTNRADELSAGCKVAWDCGAEEVGSTGACASAAVQLIVALRATIPTRQKAFMSRLDTEPKNKSRESIEATEQPLRDSELAQLICESRMKLDRVLF